MLLSVINKLDASIKGKPFAFIYWEWCVHYWTKIYRHKPVLIGAVAVVVERTGDLAEVYIFVVLLDGLHQDLGVAHVPRFAHHLDL